MPTGIEKGTAIRMSLSICPLGPASYSQSFRKNACTWRVCLAKKLTQSTSELKSTHIWLHICEVFAVLGVRMTDFHRNTATMPKLTSLRRWPAPFESVSNAPTRAVPTIRRPRVMGVMGISAVTWPKAHGISLFVFQKHCSAHPTCHVWSLKSDNMSPHPQWMSICLSKFQLFFQKLQVLKEQRNTESIG